MTTCLQIGWMQWVKFSYGLAMSIGNGLQIGWVQVMNYNMLIGKILLYGLWV